VVYSSGFVVGDEKVELMLFRDRDHMPKLPNEPKTTPFSDFPLSKPNE